MMKNILIADTAFTPIFSLAERIRRLKSAQIIPISSATDRSFAGEDAPTLVLWNRNSSFSALSAIRQAAGLEFGFDVAIVAFDPFEQTQNQLPNLSAVEELINTHIRSYLLLFKEIDDYFNNKEKGLLIPILYRKNENFTFYEKIAASTFFSIIEQMIHDKNRQYSIQAIDCGNLSISNIENLVIQLLQDSPKSKITGKWFSPDNKNPLRSLFLRH